MVTVQSRVLNRPSIVYNNEKMPVQINKQAHWNLRLQQVCPSEKLKDWGIMWIAQTQKDLQMNKTWFDDAVVGFVKTLRETLGKENVEEPREQRTITIANVDEHNLKKDFDLRKSQGFQLLVVVLPDGDTSRYNLIKKLGDIDCGISTVCMRFEHKKFQPGALPYFANVALKINLKLGGINHKLRDQRGLYANTMVIGVDVTHPSPGATQKTAPSVAAMVASVDSQVLLLYSHLPPIKARC